MLAYLHARHAGGNRLEVAAHVHGGRGLEVERLQLARRPVEVEQDDRLRLAEAAPGPRGGRGLRFVQAQQVGQAEAEKAQAAGAQGLAASQAITEARVRSEKAQHRLSP